MLISSIFRVALFLNKDIIIARPTAASAAATVITIKTNICPCILPRNEENATNVRFIELSINSMHIKIIIAFLRTKTPITPVMNKIAATIKYKFNDIID